MPKRKYYRKIYQKSKEKNKFFLIIKILTSFLFIFLLTSVFLFLYYIKDFPRPEKFTERQFPQSTKIYDRSGQILLYDIHGEEKRTYVSLEKVPKYLKQAVIATEDANFYNHYGVDFEGIIRAVSIDLRLKKPVYGGSTIPQQLIRSAFLSTEKTAERKIREAVLALELDRRYSKEQILEWYLNQIPLGPNIYGVEAASQVYFKKPVSEISLAEAAILASLIKSPSYFYNNQEDLLIRKNYVLDRMWQEGYLTKEIAEEIKGEKVELSKITHPIKAPYFTLEVVKILEEDFGYSRNFLEEKGWKIYATLDWNLQQAAEKAVIEGAVINKYYGAYNAALTAINPKSGEVLAMVGSAAENYFSDPYPEGCQENCKIDPRFNVATSGKRQPGSAFKPFIYATAFEKGYDDNTLITDERTNFGIYGGKLYIPENYDGRFRGEITLREALAQSINVPAVKVFLDLAGIKESINTAKKMGISTYLPEVPSLVLGGGEVTLLDMVSAYGTFATEGNFIPSSYILKIEDAQGNVIEINKKNPKKVLSIKTCRLINDILSDNDTRAPMFGKKSALYFENYQVAAKTGTTDNYVDGWTIGYTPSLVVGVWAGNNDNSPTNKKPGVVLAGPIFHNFMGQSLPNFPKETFLKPLE